MIKGSFDFESLKIDQNEFESLFTDTSNPDDKKKKAVDKPAVSKQKKSVQVIDAKRGMNGGIILARLKIEFTALAEMVNNMYVHIGCLLCVWLMSYHLSPYSSSSLFSQGTLASWTILS
jgi:hypothetical protein